MWPLFSFSAQSSRRRFADPYPQGGLGRVCGLGRYPGLMVPLAAILLALLPNAALAVGPITWNFLKDNIEEALVETFGREVTIAGDVRVRPARRPVVVLNEVRVAGPEWSEEPYILQVGTLAVTVRLAPLIRGNVVITKVRLEEPRLILEAGADDQVNWTFPALSGASEQAAEPAAPPGAEDEQADGVPTELEEVVVEDGQIRYRDAANGRTLTARLDQLRLARQDEGLELSVEGQVEGEPLSLEASAGSLQALLGEGVEPFPVRLEVRSRNTVLHAEGTIAAPLSQPAPQLTFDLQGQDLARWSALAGTDLPEVPPFAVSGQISRNGGTWQVSDLGARLGATDLSGQAVLATDTEALRVEAQLRANHVDMPQLLAITAQPEQPETAGVDIPDLPALAGRIALQADTLTLPQGRLANATATLDLSGQTLTVADAGVDLGGGRVSAAGSVSIGPQTLQADLRAEASEVALGPAAETFAVSAPEVEGSVSGTLEVALGPMPRQGITVEDLLAHLHLQDGAVTLQREDEDTALTLRPRTLPAETGPPAVRVGVEGRYQGTPIDATLMGDPLVQLVGDRSAYALTARLATPGAQLQVSSTLGELLAPGGPAFEGEVEVEQLTALEPFLGTALPPLPPGAFSARVQREDQAWTVSDVDLNVGDTALTGAATIQIDTERPQIYARIEASRIDLPELLEVAAAAGPAEQDGAQPEAVEPADILAPLQRFGGQISLKADTLLVPGGEVVRDVEISAGLEDGRLTLQQLALQEAGGTIRVSGELDTGTRPAEGALTLAFDDLRAEALWRLVTPVEESLGTLSGELQIRVVEASAGALAQDVALPFLGRLKLDGTVHFRDPPRDTDLVLSIETQGLADGRQRTFIAGDGRYRGEPAHVEFAGDALLNLRDPDRPYGLRLEVELAETTLLTSGTVLQPFALKGVDLRGMLAGPNPQRLKAVLGVPFPDLPPYRVEGELAYRENRWEFTRLWGEIGDSDVAGRLTLEGSGDRPLLIADLQSQWLDLDDLGGLVGAAPEVGPGETAAPEQVQEARQEEQIPGILPTDPIKLQRLRTADARVSYRAQRVLARGVPVDELVIDLTLEDGELAFEPLAFGVAGGAVTTNLILNAREYPLDGTLEAEARRVDLRPLVKDLPIADDSVGIIGGQAKLWMRGNSIAELLGSADGGLSLVMSGGQLDALLVELAGLDAGEAVLVWLAGREAVPIDCAYTELHSRRGIARLTNFVVDTADTLFLAEGSIDLGRERLDITLRPHPKDISGPTARAPLYLRGSFEQPDLDIGTTRLAVRVAAAAALAVLATPFAAILPMIEPGTGGESVYCQGLAEQIQAVQQER